MQMKIVLTRCAVSSSCALLAAPPGRPSWRGPASSPASTTASARRPRPASIARQALSRHTISPDFRGERQHTLTYKHCTPTDHGSGKRTNEMLSCQGLCCLSCGEFHRHGGLLGLCGHLGIAAALNSRIALLAALREDHLAVQLVHVRQPGSAGDEGHVLAVGQALESHGCAKTSDHATMNRNTACSRLALSGGACAHRALSSSSPIKSLS